MKFKDQIFYKPELKPLSDNLSRRTRSDVRIHWLDIVQIYRRIETRGFYITMEGSAASCPENLLFTDRVQIQPSEKL
jgi:hypothetical protein